MLPVIALEGVAPGVALKRSTEIIRARWGEGVVGSAAVSQLMFLLIFLPGGAMIFSGVEIHRHGVERSLISAGE